MLPLTQSRLPDFARDIKLNLQGAATSSLTPAQRHGVAITAAATACNVNTLHRASLLQECIDGAKAELGEGAAPVIDEALAAATMMAMNNVYYRFRHMIHKPVYSEKPARLRMMRLGKPSTSRVDLELFSLAASAINACEACVQAHEKVVLEGGLSEDQVHDAVRLAAVICAAAVALELAEANR